MSPARPGSDIVAAEIVGAVLGAANLADVVGKVGVEINAARVRELPRAAGITLEYLGRMHADLYRRWLFEVWGNGDATVAEELVHRDLLDHNAVPGQPAGREGDLWAARQVRTAFPDLRFTADVVFESDDLVTGRWTMTGTHTGPLEMLGLPPTGRPVTMTGQEIFRVAQGQFVEVWHLEDVGSLMRSLHLEPPRMMLRLAAGRSARRYRKGR